PWFVLTETGSATRMGLVFAAEAAPIALLGMPSGAVVQRLGGRTTVLVCDAVRAPLVALVPLLHLLHALPFAALIGLVIGIGVFTAPYFAATRMVLPEVIGEDAARVMQANALVEGAQRLTGVAGPAVGGALIAVLGAANVVWLDAASYAVAVSLVALLVAADRTAPTRADVRGLLVGLRFIARDPVLGPVTLEILLVGLFIPLLFSGLPLLAFERFGGSALVAGTLASAWSGGALLGAIGAYRVAARAAPLTVAAWAAPWFALPIWSLAFAVPAWALALALAISGCAVPFLNAPVVALLTVRTPPALRAKVMTTASTAEVASSPIGYALTGPAFAVLGSTGGYALVAAGITLAMAILVDTARRALVSRVVSV
ncbi:MAG: MFS transporter, partial [Rhodanobacteraceae bacterium]